MQNEDISVDVEQMDPELGDKKMSEEELTKKAIEKADKGEILVVREVPPVRGG